MGIEAALVAVDAVAGDVVRAARPPQNGALPGTIKKESDDPTAIVVMNTEVHLLLVVNDIAKAQQSRPVRSGGTESNSGCERTVVRGSVYLKRFLPFFRRLAYILFASTAQRCESEMP